MAFRPRLRSTQGCDTCRRRRVKCDQKRPVCGNCRRAAQSCSFQPNPEDNPAYVVEVHETRKRTASGDETVLTLENSAFNIALLLPPGVSEKVYPTLRFCCNNVSACFRSPGDDKPNVFLVTLLPIACQRQEVLHALVAIFSVFTPRYWVERATTSLYLSSLAVTELRKSLLQRPGARPTEDMLLTAGLLYLFELHNRSAEGADFSHLFGVGSMLKAIVEGSDDAASIPTMSMESYAYHAVLSSTCNPDILSPHAAIHYAEQYLVKLARLRGVSLSGLRILDIRANTIIRVYRIAFLRREVLLGKVSPRTFKAVKHDLSLQQAHTYVPDPAAEQAPMPLAPLEEIFSLACHIFAVIVLRKALQYLPETLWDCPAAEQGTFETEIEGQVSAIRSICSQSYLDHVAVWPLFVIALAAGAPQFISLRDMIEACLQRHVDESRFGATQQVIDILKAARDTNRGPSLLMAHWLKNAVMF